MRPRTTTLIDIPSGSNTSSSTGAWRSSWARRRASGRRGGGPPARVRPAGAKRGGRRGRGLGEPPGDLPIGGHRARREGVRVVLTVGSDAAVGKMTAALEIVAALRRAGERVEFVATGQTGIAIAGGGIAVDAVVADFIAGAAELMVCDAAERADWVVVEGQGSLTHPGVSGVTLGLLH